MCMDPVDLEGFVFMVSFISFQYMFLTAKSSFLFTWRILFFVYVYIFNIDLKQCTFPYFIYKTYEGRYDSHLKLLLKRNNRAYELWVMQLYRKEHFIFPWRSMLMLMANGLESIDCHQTGLIKHPATGFECKFEALRYCLILKHN